MQTFLPYPSFVKSVKALDPKRLGKQRVEAFQILKIVSGERVSGGWINHPATKMWMSYPDALAMYMDACILEWVRRGYNNTMQLSGVDYRNVILPEWIGDEEFHASHRSNLLRKDFKFYSALGWTDDPTAPYIWPANR